jgi:NADPH:quinone reductase-like Zn-dependent oxidoreductase
MTGGSAAQFFQALLLGPWLSKRGGKTLAVLETKPSRDDLCALNSLLEAGQVTPIIDRTFPLLGVPDAIRYIEQGRARGKVVITISHSSES